MSSLFSSTFTSKVLHETDAANVLSPTSILDTLRPFSSFKNPFFSSESHSLITTNAAEHKRFREKSDCCKGLVDALDDDDAQQFPRTRTRTVLFGSQLRMMSQTQPQKSAFASASGSANSALDETNNNGNSPPVFMRCVSLNEMELSEDYRRVAYNGLNPTITNIFRNCIGRNSGINVAKFPTSSAMGRRGVYYRDHQNRIRYPSERFLSFCFYCSKDLRGEDIYMYRGERAFCSRDCRQIGMLFEPPQLYT